MKVTIGIPTYNQASFIETAVSSALAQTYPHLEVIVADDGSNDNTAALLQPYLSDPRFIYSLNKKNLGRVNNYRHLLYNLASGDWYVNMDGDDYFTDPDFISNAVKAINKNSKVVAVIADCKVLNEQTGNTILYTSPYKNEEVVDGYRLLEDIQKLLAHPTHLTTIYKRQKAMDINFYSSSIMSSDFESLFRLVLHGNIIYLKQTVGVWRHHGNNLVAIKSLDENIQNLEFPQLVFTHACSMGKSLGKWKKAMLQNMISSLLIEAKKKGKLNSTFFKILRHYPLHTLRVLFKFSSVIKHLKPQ